MSKGLAVLLGALAGGLVGMQAPINSRLGKSVGSVEAATFSFLVGTAALVLILLVASLVSGVLGEVLNAALIAAMVVLSVGLNFYQVFSSEQAARRWSRSASCCAAGWPRSEASAKFPGGRSSAGCSAPSMCSSRSKRCGRSARAG